MANTITALMPRILAQGLGVLRQRSVMPSLVNSDYSMDAKKKGSTIDVPLPPSYTERDVTAAEVPPTPNNSSFDQVQVTLNHWKEVPFFLTDKDMMEVDRNLHFVPMAVQAAVETLARGINGRIHDCYKGVYGFAGTAGSTPFQSTVTGITDARKVLNQQLAPMPMRRVVLDHTAEANALALAQFSDFDRTNDKDVKIEGQLGRKFGFDWFADDAVKTHTAGTWTSAVVGASAAVGNTSLTVEAKSAALELKFGDIFTIAGDSQTYTVMTSTSTSIAASGTGTIQIAPPLKTAPAAQAVLTVKATHTVNLVFQRNAFAYAQRPLETAYAEGLGPQVMMMADPKTGINLRLEVSRQHRQTQWAFDVLYGTKLVRPELAVRLAG